MKNYVGMKQIKAEQMNLGEYNEYRGWQIPEDEDSSKEGYLVAYPDKYESWSPKEIFDKAYRSNGNISGGIALELVKQGFTMARAGWSGKGLYVQMNKGGDYGFSEILPFMVIKNVKNSFNTWVPSISDIFADDWMIVSGLDEG